MDFLFPQFDFFSNSGYSLSVLHHFDEKLSPLNTISHVGTLEFNSPPYLDKCKSLSEIFIYAKLQLTKSDGKLYSKEDTLQPKFANNILFTMFKNCRIYLNNVMIVNYENFGFKDFIESITNYSYDSCVSQYTLQNLEPNHSFSKTDHKFNLGENSKIVDFYGRLNVLPSKKVLIPNVSLSLKFEFGPKYMFINENVSELNGKQKIETESSIKIHEITAFVRHYILRDSFNLKLETELSKSYILYEFRKGQILNLSIPSNTNFFNQPNLLTTLRPLLLCFTLVTNEQYMGNAAKDSFQFTTHNLQSANFLINNEKRPQIPYEFALDENNNICARALSALFGSVGQRGVNEGSLISRYNYHNLFLCAEDCTPIGTALTDLTYPTEYCTLGINLEFEKPTTEPLVLLFYIYSSSKFRINSNRSIDILS